MANTKYGWWNIQDLKVKLEGVDFLFSDLSEESQNHIIELIQDGYIQGQIIEEDEEILNDTLKEMIINEVNQLEEVDDSIGIKINNNKGLFIQVVDYGEGKEYFIELNNIDSEGAYEPCADYNASSEYGYIESLLDTIEDYLEDNL